MTVHQCESLDEVREQIDRLDRSIVALIAERGQYVQQVMRFKQTVDDVQAPQRVEQVIAKVRALAEGYGADAEVVEQIYRAMIAAFIDVELADLAARDGND